eukprot:UN23123
MGGTCQTEDCQAEYATRPSAFIYTDNGYWLNSGSFMQEFHFGREDADNEPIWGYAIFGYTGEPECPGPEYVMGCDHYTGYQILQDVFCIGSYDYCRDEAKMLLEDHWVPVRPEDDKPTDVCEDVDCNEEARRYCYDDYLVSSDGYGMCKEDDSDEGYHCEMSEDRREHCDYGCDEEERRCMDHESEDSSSSDSMECEWMDLGMGMCRGPHGEAAPNFSADGFTQEKCMHACEETDGCFGVSLSRGGRCAMWMKEMPDYEHK